MTLFKRWNKGKATISAPEQFVHTGHGSHDEMTLKLQGLPEEWVQILRENGVVGEDLVLPKKTKSDGFYGNTILNLSSSSLLSNRSLQKLWRGVSRKSSRSQSFDDRTATIETLKQIARDQPKSQQDAEPGFVSSPAENMDESPVSPLESPDIVQSPTPSRQPTFDAELVSGSKAEEIAQDCGLTSKHKDYEDINPNLFEVVDSLGHGSLGVVEEVRVSPQHVSFVRKRVQIPYYKRRQYLKIINQEAQALRNLSHSHIVKMIGSYSEVPDSGRQFYSILMAPVGQRDLKTFLEIVGDKSTERLAGWHDDRKVWIRNWFKCLSSALAYIHSKGVRHQDIKPSNIIHRRSAIYFTDFSSASQFQIGQTTSTENPARTSAMYAAPEVINSDGGLARHGRGTDVFALGAVFTEMLAVLRGSSIDEYHQYLIKGIPDEPGSAARQTFLFGKKLREIESFFGEDGFFEACVWNMLLPDRDQRPDASEVAVQIRGFSPWILRGCSCDSEFI